MPDQSSRANSPPRRALRVLGRVPLLLLVLLLVLLAAGGAGWLVAREAQGGRIEGAHLAIVERSPRWRDGRFQSRRPRVDGPFVRTPTSTWRPCARSPHGAHVSPSRSGWARTCRRGACRPIRSSSSTGGTPLWSDVHLGPEQAVRTHRLVRGRVMLPVHWATFDLALHGWTEPIERVLVAAAAGGVRVATPRPGEPVEPATLGTPRRWWPTLPWRTAREAPALSTGVAHLMQPLPLPAP